MFVEHRETEFGMADQKVQAMVSLPDMAKSTAALFLFLVRTLRFSVGRSPKHTPRKSARSWTKP